MDQLPRDKVLIAGAFGHFGWLLIEDLRRYTDCRMICPSRAILDLGDPASIEAALDGVKIAICAAGPFQKLPHTLAELCLQRGIHYIDLADDRAFVRKVRSLVPAPDRVNSAVCSGWSTVSALSGALTSIGAAGLDSVDAVYIHMAPGNRLPRGTGTIASFLHSVGRPFTVYRGGKWHTVRGWAEPRRFSFPEPVGVRTGYLVDVPDHESFPEMFGAQTVEFRTAAEFGGLNSAVSCLAWLAKRGLVDNFASRARMLQRGVALVGFIGHDWGGVGVEVTGSAGGRHVTRRVSVVARSGGQRIAVMPASIMTGMLLSGTTHRGVVSPAGWITREGLHDECEKRGFQLIVD